MAIFLRQFLSPFIYILLIAAVVSLVLSQLPNAVFILAVLLLNAGIGTVQEYSAQQSAAALREMVRGEARVIRDGTPRRIDAEALVPGDLILLSSGDRVPADIDLYTSFSLAIDASDCRNTEAFNFDGEEVRLTVRTADAFNNPVPTGTSVSLPTGLPRRRGFVPRARRSLRCSSRLANVPSTAGTCAASASPLSRSRTSA